MKKYFMILTVFIAVIAVLGTSSMVGAASKDKHHKHYKHRKHHKHHKRHKHHPGLAYVFTIEGVEIIDIQNGTVTSSFAGVPRSSWPDNFGSRKIGTTKSTTIWANIGKPPLDADGEYRGMFALDTDTGAVTKVITGSKSGNWVIQSPDGRWAYGAARDPANEYLKFGGNPACDDFAQVVDSVPIPAGPNINPAKSGPGPCDAAMTSDGFYIWEPDIWNDTVTRVDTGENGNPFGIGLQYPTTRLDPAVRVEPFMTTVSPDDQYVLAENLEGKPNGTESVIDISDPDNPKEVVRFVQDSRLAALAGTYPGLIFFDTYGNPVEIKGGMGSGPRSNEFTTDGKYSLIINAKSNDVKVVDMATLDIICSVAFPAHPTGGQYKADTGDWSLDGKQLLLNLETTNEVGVIGYDDDAVGCAKFSYLNTIPLSGTKPQGIVVKAAKTKPLECDYDNDHKKHKRHKRHKKHKKH